jgi:tetratricopeptide (TPR) repeat protein
MREHCEREQFVNTTAGRGATSSPLLDLDQGLVVVPKRHLLSWSISAAVLLLGSLIIFSPLIEGGTTHAPVLIMRLLLFGALTVWTIHQMRVGVIVLTRNRLIPLAALFLGWAGFSLWWAPYKNPSIQWFISLLMYAVFSGVVLQGVRTRQQVRQVVMVLVGMGLCEGVLGIIQYVWLGEARAKGTFFNPNFFATYEVVTMAITFGLLSYQRPSELNWTNKAFLWCTSAIAFLAFVMAQSRGAVLAFLIMALFLGVYRFGKLALVCLLVLVLAGFVLPNPIKQRVLDVSAHDPYAYTRFEIWENSLHRVADNPWGTGLGMYKYFSFQYRFPIENSIVQYGKRAESAHNEYLQIAVELGVGGLALFLLGIGVWGWGAKAVIESSLSSWEKGAVVGLSGAVVAILVHAAVDSVFHEPALVLLLILCGSLVLVVKRLDSPEYAPVWSIRFPYHPARVAIVGLIAAASAFLIIQPAAAWFANEKGNIASQSGQSDRAWEWYRRAILIDSGTTAYHDAAARMNVMRFYASGDPQQLIEAVEEMAICQDLNPLDGRIPFRLGMIYLLLAEQVRSEDQKSNLMARAVASYEEAIKIDPFSPFNYLQLAKIRWRQGQVENAQALLTKSITYEPNFLPARVFLARLASESGQINIAQSQRAAIESVQEQYKGQAVSSLEHQYLDVNLNLRDQRLLE